MLDTLEKNFSEGKTDEVLKLLNSKNDLPAAPLISILRKHLEKVEVQTFFIHPRIFSHLKYYLCREEDDLCAWYLQHKDKENIEATDLLVKAVRTGDRAEISKAVKLCKNQYALELYFAGLSRQRLVPQKPIIIQSVESPAQALKSVEEERRVKKQKYTSNDFTLDSLILEK